MPLPTPRFPMELMSFSEPALTPLGVCSSSEAARSVRCLTLVGSGRLLLRLRLGLRSRRESGRRNQEQRRNDSEDSVRVEEPSHRFSSKLFRSIIPQTVAARAAYLPIRCRQLEMGFLVRCGKRRCYEYLTPAAVLTNLIADLTTRGSPSLF